MFLSCYPACQRCSILLRLLFFFIISTFLFNNTYVRTSGMSYSWYDWSFCPNLSYYYVFWIGMRILQKELILLFIDTLSPNHRCRCAREVHLVLPSASCRPRSDSLYLWTLREMATCVATDMTWRSRSLNLKSPFKAIDPPSLPPAACAASSSMNS